MRRRKEIQHESQRGTKFLVAQIFNLLYRRISFGWAWKYRSASPNDQPADCKSAIQQDAILRYELNTLRLRALAPFR